VIAAPHADDRAMAALRFRQRNTPYVEGDTRMRVLVVDIGGTNVKILATGETEPRKFPSGPALTPIQMVAGVKQLAGDWTYDAVTIGYPGPVLHGRISSEPHNLGGGWVEFDFNAAFGRPVRIVNDGAMQALGSYKSGLLLFLGLGTGLGTALVADGVLIPMELAHLSFRNGTYEKYLGVRALRRLGRKKWEKNVELITAELMKALHPDDVVLGGGNAKKLKALPAGCRAGTNANAFIGGFRVWETGATRPSDRPPRRPAAKRSSKSGTV
jgi:polyphosphate glucokinase